MQQRSGADLQPLPERSVPLLRAPPPAGVSPPPQLICMALPLPRCHWPAPRPAHCPSITAGFRPPSRPELRAAGGLLNRGGGGGRGGSGTRSGYESAAPRVGGGGRAARDHLSKPHHSRTEGAAAEGSQGAPAGEWPASQRRAERGGSPQPGTAAAREGRAKETAGWTCGPGDRSAALSLTPESSELLDSTSRHRIALYGRGRTAAKFKRLNLTALAEAEGRDGVEGGVGADLSAVTWVRGGAWQASLLFWLARAQRAGHVVFWARPLPRWPRLAGCGCGVGCFGEALRRGCLRQMGPLFQLIIFTLFQADVDLAFRITWDGGESRELLRNGVATFVPFLCVLKGLMLPENLRIRGVWQQEIQDYVLVIKETTGKEEASFTAEREGTGWIL